MTCANEMIETAMGDYLKAKKEFQFIGDADNFIQALIEDSRIRREDIDDRFDSFLDEINGDVTVLGMRYSTSRVFKEVDPIAYRCIKVDWLSGEYSIIEINGEYYDYDSVKDLLEDYFNDFDEVTYDATNFSPIDDDGDDDE